MANIYLRDEVVEEIDKQRATPKGEIDRSDYLTYLLDTEKKRK